MIAGILVHLHCCFLFSLFTGEDDEPHIRKKTKKSDEVKETTWNQPDEFFLE